MLLNPYRFAPASADPLWANVTSRMRFDGANGSTVFEDVKGLAWSAVGNAAISTTQSKFGSASLRLDGNLDGVSLGASGAFDFGSGDFTVEMWLYVIAHTNVTAAILATGAGAWVAGQRVFRFDTGNRLSFYPHEGGPVLVGATAFPVGVWRHIALVRSGATLRIFLHGVQDASASISNTVNFNSGGKTFLGYSDFDDLSLNGYIDELRVTKGVARYIANFTPPSAPFPDS